MKGAQDLFTLNMPGHSERLSESIWIKKESWKPIKPKPPRETGAKLKEEIMKNKNEKKEKIGRGVCCGCHCKKYSEQKKIDECVRDTPDNWNCKCAYQA